jgi:hypothetical protein
MYHPAIVALMALAVLNLVDFACDNIPWIDRLRLLVVFVAAVGGMWILDYSLFDGFDVAVRNHAVGVSMTGFIVAGLTVAWRAAFRWLTHDRAQADETLGEHRTLLRKGKTRRSPSRRAGRPGPSGVV